MTRTTILFGPPGTGKTTSLLDAVDAAIQAGVDPSHIGFFAFTRKAAHEAISRAVQRFGLSEDDLPWFRTLHSAAFKMLGLRHDEVMGTSHYRELGSALGSYTFEYNYDETTERPPRGGGLGDRALMVYALARAQMIPLDQQWLTLNDPDISLHDARRFEAALIEYKKAYGLLDFNDFLDHPSHSPLDLDLLIIDESQDLTAQQWRFAQAIGATARQVVLAGDDDQGIYQWSGADLRTFLSLKGSLQVLPKSYRLPPIIWQFANSIASRIKIRKSKSWAARDEGSGSIQHLAYADQAPLAGNDSWLLLARHQYQLGSLQHLCRDQGVVYQHEGLWSNQAPSVRAVVAYERLRRGETISGAQVDLVARFIGGMTQPHSQAAAVGWGSVAWPFNGKPDWMEALTGIGNNEREYIRRLRREGESLNKPGRVIISTIHGSKGGEANNVMLLPDISKRVMDGMARDRDQEMRVWYVAVSRAIDNLYMVRPQTRRFMEL